MKGTMLSCRSQRKQSIERADSTQPGRRIHVDPCGQRPRHGLLSVSQTQQTTERMAWIELPCRLFRKDLQRQQSKCHMDSIRAESHAAASRVSGGIRSASFYAAHKCY